MCHAQCTILGIKLGAKRYQPRSHGAEPPDEVKHTILAQGVQ